MGLAAGVQVGLLNSPVPLGVPGEWVWTRMAAGFWSPLMLLVCLLLLAAYIGYLRWGAGLISRVSARQRVALLLGMWGLGSLLFWQIRGIPEEVYGHPGLTWVTYYPRMTGYFTQARESTDVPLTEFLAGYEATVAAGDYLHQGTHPPGLPLYFRGLRSACEHWPGLQTTLLAIEPTGVSLGIDVLAELEARSGQTFTPTDRAVLWGNLLLTVLGSLATLFPLFVICARFQAEKTGWWLAGLWPLTPGLLVFVPKDDTLFPLFAASTTALFVTAVTKPQADRAGRGIAAVLAGFTLFLGLLCSLALLVVPVILACWVLLKALFGINAAGISKGDSFWPESPSAENPRGSLLISVKLIPWGVVITSLLGLLLPVLVLAWCCELNLLSVWKINLAKHAEFYTHNVRTYAAWLLVNPLELAFSLGLPVAAALLAFAVSRVRTGRKYPLTARDLLVMAVWLTWGLLWLSGKNMGEAARLWLFLLPLVLLTGLLSPSEHRSTDASSAANEISPASAMPWTWLVVFQAFAAIATTLAVDGFDYAAVLRP